MRHLLSKTCAFTLISWHTSTAWAQTTTHDITQAIRLSEWLHQTPSPYPLATSWSTPEEAKKQTEAHQRLIAQLQQQLREPEQNAFLQWLQTQTPTGRVRLAAAQAHWLDANPQRNPLLLPGDTLTTASRATHISIISGNGQGCRLAHQPQTYPADHLQACPHLAASAAQDIWVIQPNGHTQTISTAEWNPMPQPQLAPQAVLWLGWPADLLIDSTSPAARAELNRATAQWLANRTDGLHSWVSQWAVTAYPTTEAAPGPAAGDTPRLTGLRGPRFAPQASASNWGTTGLVQTPTARMRPAGSLSVTYSRSQPYSHLNVILQPLDGLEAGFRYTDIANVRYGPAALSGTQSYKDKSFEVKARLLDESRLLPAVAVGVRDLGGTGLFGSEYLVANKRWGRFDASLGLGWGYMANRQNLANPLSAISPRFDQRQNDFGSGGTVSTTSFFRGRTALFGGLEYQSPWGPVFKAEYDSNNYQREPFNNNQRVSSPLNIGLSHRLAPGLDLTVSRERGTTWTVGLTLHTNLSKLYSDKPSDKPTPSASASRPTNTPNWAQTSQDIEELTQWRVEQIAQHGRSLVLELAESDSAYHRARIDKAMVVLHRDAPANIDHVELRHRAAGDVLAIDHIDRQSWLQPQLQPARTQQPNEPAGPGYTAHYPAAHSTSATDLANPGTPLLTAAPVRQLQPRLQFSQSLGGPDAFLLYQLSLALDYQHQLPFDAQLSGTLNAGLFNNYDRFKYTAPSQLPRVRTYMREYMTESRFTLPRLYVSRASRLSTDWTVGAYGGYLEEMYAGAGAEALYRPPGSRWAFGVDVNQVQQRDFAQNFSLRDYKTATGHASLYWQTPWQDVQVTLQAGQYLAKDRGATLRVSRSFSNGSSIGAFATKTNVSAAQFGEGSFNKGVFWSIPFDAFMTRSSRSQANFNWVPLTRDGGAQLNRPAQLMQTTHMLDPRSYTQAPARKPNDYRIPDDRD
jgi:hypothetical protein